MFFRRSSSLINGSPTALCLVWWVMVYATSPISHSLAICSMICVFPIPGGPINRTGRCLTAGILYSPNASLLRYACTVCLISSFACLMFMVSPCLLCQNILLFHPESHCPRWTGTPWHSHHNHPETEMRSYIPAVSSDKCPCHP